RDWSSDVCSSDLGQRRAVQQDGGVLGHLGVRLAADRPFHGHAAFGDGLAAFAAGQAGALGQAAVQPHHAPCSWVMAAVLPRTARIRSAGAHSIWVPMRPPDTSIAGWARQLSSKTVTYCFFMPSGLQPPRTYPVTLLMSATWIIATLLTPAA